jgi:hypothetical protein
VTVLVIVLVFVFVVEGKMQRWASSSGSSWMRHLEREEDLSTETEDDWTAVMMVQLLVVVAKMIPTEDWYWQHHRPKRSKDAGPVGSMSGTVSLSIHLVACSRYPPRCCRSSAHRRVLVAEDPCPYLSIITRSSMHRTPGRQTTVKLFDGDERVIDPEKKGKDW